MKYKAIIFDLDGVICHTDQYHYQAWKHIADELNIYFDEDRNNQLRGISRMESLEMILKSYPKNLTEQEKIYYANQKNEYYRKLLQFMSPESVSVEVKTTLDSIKNTGILMAIGSSSKNARFILQQIHLTDYFTVISDGNNITQSKPHPEVFLKASEYLNVNPQDCLVVEDAKAGIDAALTAKMDCAAIGDAKEHPHATYKLDSFASLMSILT